MSAVPTACAGTDSVTSVLNWALSAITKNPHVIARAPSIQIGPPKRTPLSRQQLPLMKREIDTSRSLPRLSANSPPQTDPKPPMAMVVNARSDINRGARNLPPDAAATLAARNAGIQVQNAYSSNM